MRSCGTTLVSILCRNWTSSSAEAAESKKKYPQKTLGLRIGSAYEFGFFLVFSALFPVQAAQGAAAATQGEWSQDGHE